MASTLRLTGTSGGNSIISANDTIAADQTFEFPNTGGTLLTGSPDETGDGGSSGSAQVVGYQYGNWIPNFGSTANEATFTFTTREGGWARIGRTVICHCTISINTVTAAGTGHLRLLSFPYESDTTANGGRGLGSCYSSTWSNDNPTHFLMTAETTEARFYIRGATDNSLSLPTANMNAGCSVYCTITYQTNDTSWTPSNSATVS